MSESQVHRIWSPEVFIALAVIGAQCLAVLHPAAIPLDQEELYNAAHARMLQLGHWPDFLTLQYRGYCGGCSINAAMGSGFFTLFGPSIVAWKLVPITYSGILALVGSRILRIHIGMPAAVAFGLLLLFPPPTYMELSLTAWGNHMESGVFAVVVLASVLRLLHQPTHLNALFVGLLTSFSLWIGFSSGFIAIAAVTCLLLGGLYRHLITVLVTGSSVAAIWLLQIELSPSSAFETIYYSGESIPELSRIPTKLWSLLAPRQLVALFGHSAEPLGWFLAWASALSVLLAGLSLRKLANVRPIYTFVISFLAVYSLVRFTVWTPPAPEVAPPGSMRYAAPLYGLLFLLHGGAAGYLWIGRKRLFASLLLVAPLVIGWQSRSKYIEAPFPDKTVFSMAAPNFSYARDQVSYLLTLEQHLSCRSTEPDAVSLHAYGVGWQQARAILDVNPQANMPYRSSTHPSALEGMSAALLQEIDANEQGGVLALTLINQRILDLTDEEQDVVITSASWRRIVAWTQGFDPHGQGRIGQWSSSISTLPLDVQAAATRAFGRRWVHDTERFRQPTDIAIPDLNAMPAALHDAFIEGHGEAIGELWGHETHPVADLPEAAKEIWQKGREKGIQRWWLTPTRLFPEYPVRR